MTYKGARYKYWAWLIVAVFMLLVSKCSYAQSTGFADLKFGQYQIADSQWNVSACMYTATCQIYSTNPGTMYKIPWTSGQWSWQAGQYLKFVASGDANYPWTGNIYNTDGSLAGTIGTGKVINMGSTLDNKSFFFFMGSDNNTGQLFSTNIGMSGTSGYAWNGVLNPDATQLNTFASATGSTAPLSSGQTYTPGPPPADWKVIRMTGTAVYITKITPVISNSPSGEQPAKAFDGSASSKYLHFDKKNSGITLTLNQGRVITKFTLTTANDSPGRDPTYYKLYGSNDGANWTLIKEDTLALSNNRYTVSPEIILGNSNAYVHYHIAFPQNKFGDCVGGDCNMVQIAEITFYYDNNNTLTSTDTSGGSIGSPAPALCCGGSSASFSANATFNNNVNAWSQVGGSRVIIEQIGNYNSATVTQSGNKNYAEIHINGSNNTTTVNQSSTSSTNANYIESHVSGNGNAQSLTQSSTGGAKGILINSGNDNNNITINQSSTGNHYAEITLSGGSKNVNLTQSGSAGHMAKIELTGGATQITATQTGSVQQFYSITHNCAQALCSAITVTQGQ